MLFLRIFCGAIIVAVILGWIFATGFLHGKALKVIGGNDESYGRAVLWGQVLPFGVLASLVPFALAAELTSHDNVPILWAIALLNILLASLVWMACDREIKKKRWNWYHDAICGIEVVLLALAIGSFAAAANAIIGFHFMIPMVMTLITWGVLMDCNAMFEEKWHQE
ncbi:hypothetical protein IKH83_02705 [Candidatus Saccharibacteria bacterium]|nr:hypothetical protein [Candidatus Saccharibacteria bacterium]